MGLGVKRVGRKAKTVASGEMGSERWRGRRWEVGFGKVSRGGGQRGVRGWWEMCGPLDGDGEGWGEVQLVMQSAGVQECRRSRGGTALDEWEVVVDCT